jgi:inorganic phosphate transporter, PiT family
MVNAFVLLMLVIVLALLFDYINGFHDTANAVATVVSTGVLPGRTAVFMAAAFNFIGAFAGVGVAQTIGGDIIENPAHVTQSVVAAALLGAIVWNLLTWFFGIPSSSSHALIGGIIGAGWCHQVVVAGAEPGAALASLLGSKGVTLALKALVLSPLFGLIGGFVLMVLLLWIVRPFRPRTVNHAFRWLQLGSAGFMAFAHGSNDAQKSMGVITMAIAAYTATLHPELGKPHLIVPIWVIIACALAMALGTSSGGWRIMKTLGHRIIRLRPINGFAAESAGALVILTASWMHAPVSTTHVISSSIMGVGASKHVSAVRWGVARSMVIAWVLTIPVSAAVSAGVYALMGWLVAP